MPGNIQTTQNSTESIITPTPTPFCLNLMVGGEIQPASVTSFGITARFDFMLNTMPYESYSNEFCSGNVSIEIGLTTLATYNLEANNYNVTQFSLNSWCVVFNTNGNVDINAATAAINQTVTAWFMTNG